MKGVLRNSTAMRWTLGLGVAAMVAIGLVLLFLLTQATDNRAMYEQNYQRLFVVNVAVAALLLLAIILIGVRLYWRLRQGRFGSRLLVRLAAVFALAGFAPGMLIYVVSFQFVSRSIETWFDVKVEGALDAGVNLGRSALDALGNDLATKSKAVSAQVIDVPDSTVALALERVREQMGAAEVILWNHSGQALAGAGSAQFQLKPERPTSTQFRNARNQKAIAWIDGIDETTVGNTGQATIKALVALSSPRFELQGEQRFLQVTQGLPASLVANALAVTDANREYQERALAREGLKRMYIGTLTLSLFLAIFGAVLLAVLIGNRIVRPLLVLADGVRQVAAGDLTPKAALPGRDELGGLTRDFAQMTRQLSEARQAVQSSMEDVVAARGSLQTILDNLTTGVMVLDPAGVIVSSNPGATRILRAPLAAFQGRSLSEVPGLEDFGRDVKLQFQLFLGEKGEHGLDHWQQSFDLGKPEAGLVGPSAQNATTLVARGAQLPEGSYLLVFDDISEIVSAQRSLAWGEVARRLAHEIKNPLTPIQLSAERLKMKLDGKVDAPEQLVLNKSVRTIVEQVDAMKRLVNEFRDYARLPSAELQAVKLNQLIAEITQLYGAENAEIPVRLELDDRCPTVHADPQQIRQVVHNLLLNAQDATASNPDAGEKIVVVKTHWSETNGRVRLSVVDHGAGFPDNILARAFEPYVTTKRKGTGLGLAVVKKIADEHGSRVDIANRLVDGKVMGAQVSLSFAVAPQTSATAPAGLGAE